MAFYRLDPWGEQRADERAAMLAYLFGSFAGVKDRRPADYLLYPNDPFASRRQTADEIRCRIQLMSGTQPGNPHGSTNNRHAGRRDQR